MAFEVLLLLLLDISFASSIGFNRPLFVFAILLILFLFFFFSVVC